MFWNKIFTKFFQRINFTFTNINAYIFIFYRKREFITISIYIDNLILRLRDTNVLEWLKGQFIKKLSLKDLDKIKIIIG